MPRRKNDNLSYWDMFKLFFRYLSNSSSYFLNRRIAREVRTALTVYLERVRNVEAGLLQTGQPEMHILSNFLISLGEALVVISDDIFEKKLSDLRSLYSGYPELLEYYQRVLLAHIQEPLSQLLCSLGLDEAEISGIFSQDEQLPWTQKLKNALTHKWPDNYESILLFFFSENVNATDLMVPVFELSASLQDSIESCWEEYSDIQNETPDKQDIIELIVALTSTDIRPILKKIQDKTTLIDDVGFTLGVVVRLWGAINDAVTPGVLGAPLVQQKSGHHIQWGSYIKRKPLFGRVQPSPQHLFSRMRMAANSAVNRAVMSLKGKVQIMHAPTNYVERWRGLLGRILALKAYTPEVEEEVELLVNMLKKLERMGRTLSPKGQMIVNAALTYLEELVYLIEFSMEADDYKVIVKQLEVQKLEKSAIHLSRFLFHLVQLEPQWSPMLENQPGLKSILRLIGQNNLAAGLLLAVGKFDLSGLPEPVRELIMHMAAQYTGGKSLDVSHIGGCGEVSEVLPTGRELMLLELGADMQRVLASAHADMPLERVQLEQTREQIKVIIEQSRAQRGVERQWSSLKAGVSQLLIALGRPVILSRFASLQWFREVLARVKSVFSFPSQSSLVIGDFFTSLVAYPRDRFEQYNCMRLLLNVEKELFGQGGGPREGVDKVIEESRALPKYGLPSFASTAQAQGKAPELQSVGLSDEPSRLRRSLSA